MGPTTYVEPTSYVRDIAPTTYVAPTTYARDIAIPSTRYVSAPTTYVEPTPYVRDITYVSTPTSAKAKRKGATCKWMFDDSAEGILGMHALAHLDPWRWSGSQSIEKTIEDLDLVSEKKSKTRPIRLWFASSDEMSFKTIEE